MRLMLEPEIDSRRSRFGGVRRAGRVMDIYASEDDEKSSSEAGSV